MSDSIGADDVINGTNGANTLNGTAGDDQINGLGGNDTLNGAGGNDILDGGAGEDEMNGGTGNDIYIVDNDDDEVNESAGQGDSDIIRSTVSFTLTNGNVEALYLVGNANNINGTGHNSSNDYIEGNDRNNRLEGLNGDDTLIGEGGNDVLMGGNGNDFLVGGDGSDRLVGGHGNDSYTIINDTDTVVESNNGGTDTVFVHWRNYTMTNHVERMIANGDTITVRGNDVANYIELNAHLDAHAHGEGGNDTMVAIFDGNLHGGAGNDTITGARENDLFGDGGNDTIFINHNRQDATGGTGDDTFVFVYLDGTGIADHARRSVIDFRASDDDIEIHDFTGDMSAVLGFGVLSASEFHSAANAAGAVAQTANHHIIFNRGTGELYYDADGTGATAQHLIGLVDVDQGNLAANHIRVVDV
jgi:Ca2+-binding RTX toxin-like protein